MKRGKWKYLLVLYFGFIVIFRKEYSFKYVSYIMTKQRCTIRDVEPSVAFSSLMAYLTFDSRYSVKYSLYLLM